MKQARLEFKKDGICHVLRLHRGENSKTGHGPITLNTYHIAKEQVYGAIEDDRRNCMDCPLSRQNGGGCYTHNGTMNLGLTHMIRALKRKQIVEYNLKQVLGFIDYIAPYIEYVRFGAYGEPVLLGEEVIRAIVGVAPKQSHTGYTHQWRNPEYQWASKYLRASTHGVEESFEAMANGWLPFMSSRFIPQGFINCPASKEAGKKTTCAECGLCHGNLGNSQKPIAILTH